MSGQPSKPGAPVVGFNHNLNYKGRVFHVQTEDSGPNHGHIITHIFMGGNILSSTKATYTDLLARIEPGEVFGAVRKLMEDQHKTMIRGLLGGTHDSEITRRTGSDTFYEPGVLANGERAPGLLVGGDKSSQAAFEGPVSKPSFPPAAAKAGSPVSSPRLPPPPLAETPAPAIATAKAPAIPAPVRPAAGLAFSVARSASPARPAPAVHLAIGGSTAAPAPARLSPAPLASTAPPIRRPMPAMPTPAPARPAVHAAPAVGPKLLDEIILNYLTADLESQRR